MKKVKAQLAIGFVCVILGFIITTHLKSVQYNQIQGEERIRNESLVQELNKEKSKNADLLEEISAMRSEIEAFRAEASENNDYVKAMSEQLRKAEILAGLSDVSGTGVIVTLNDSKVEAEKNPENYIIHDDDIRKVVNELFAAGAEAVSVNGDRIVSTSAIRCVGPVIIINNNKYSPPYEIRAIGNSQTLAAALNQRDGVVDILRNLWKIEITVKEEANITVPRYSGTINFKYATPVLPQ